jgi:transposase InsO family protein
VHGHQGDRDLEGKICLSFVLDCFSRRVVGWSMRADMPAGLVVDALEMAVARRQPEPGGGHHFDQGQYVSLAFGQNLRKARIAQSMGSKGDLFGNAAIESYDTTIVKELLRGRSFAPAERPVAPSSTVSGATRASATAHPSSSNATTKGVMTAHPGRTRPAELLSALDPAAENGPIGPAHIKRTARSRRR